jgi:hypothetical protein
VETYKNQNFQGKSFILDEVTFLECKLSDCDLYYSGGDFEWVNSHFENCRFHWRGPAKNTLALLQVMGALKPQQKPPESSGLILGQTQKPN